MSASREGFLLPEQVDVVVLGAGQAGLATGYFLKRSGLSFVLLDAESGPGGAWRHGWESLRLFSPAQWSSLPGWPMPPAADGFPTRAEVLSYLSTYESRYEFAVLRPVHVSSVSDEQDHLVVHTNAGPIAARAVVSATGTWSSPFIPDYPGKDMFEGVQLHSAQYRRPEPFEGKRILVVGGSNSGAQILAELSHVAEVTWVTLEEPVFLPDDVDGRVLFERATARWKAQQAGLLDPMPPGNLGNIVMVAPVREARERGVLKRRPPFAGVTPRGVRWTDGQEEPFDAIVWCTGFRPALQHLAALGVLQADGQVQVEGTRSVVQPRLMLRHLDSYAVEIIITLALATAGYSLAEYFHVSAPLAVVIMGLVIGNVGKAAMSERTREHLFSFWELLDELLNLLLFALIGLEVVALTVDWSQVWIGFLAIPVVLFARLASVGTPFLALKEFRRSSPNAVPIMTWGGLRGGISIALALSLPAAVEGRDLIIGVTYVVVVFSLLVQATTLGGLIGYLARREARARGTPDADAILTG